MARPLLEEERIAFEPTFDIDITRRCNARCRFCFQKGRGMKGEMTLGEFTGIVDQIKQLSARAGKTFGVCISGGEPFLNQHVVEMTAYAAKQLGRKNVEITTNLSRFPTDPKQGAEMLRAMGRPKLNISVDREHLQFIQKARERLLSIQQAAKQTSTRLLIINVAQSKYEQQHLFPREVAGVISGGLRKGTQRRREQFTSPEMVKTMRQFFSKAAAGKFPHMPYELIRNLRITPSYVRQNVVPVRISFAPDGRAYLFQGITNLYFPQLSLGSWKREPLEDILGANLSFKYEMLRGWFGMVARGERLPWGGYRPVVPTREKAQLFGKWALKKFERQRAVMRAKRVRPRNL